MTKPKDIDPESAIGGEEPTGPDNGQEVSADLAEPLESPAATTLASQASAGRKTSGPKDAVPFRWKLVGKSHGVVLTLFKAVEREEVEAQLAVGGATAAAVRQVIPGLEEQPRALTLQEQVDALAEARGGDSVKTIRGWLAS